METIVGIDALVKIELSTVIGCANSPFKVTSAGHRRDICFFNPCFQFVPVGTATNDVFFEVPVCKGCGPCCTVFMETKRKQSGSCHCYRNKKQLRFHIFMIKVIKVTTNDVKLI